MRHELPQPPEAASNVWHPATTESRTARFILVGWRWSFSACSSFCP